jgi:hypothetical protein
VRLRPKLLFEGCFRPPLKGNVVNRLGAVEISVLERHADDIAFGEKSGDHSTAVMQESTDAQVAFQDREDMIGAISFEEHDLARRCAFDRNSVEKHAEAHRLLWDRYLLKQLPDIEIVRQHDLSSNHVAFS